MVARSPIAHAPRPLADYLPWRRVDMMSGMKAASALDAGPWCSRILSRSRQPKVLTRADPPALRHHRAQQYRGRGQGFAQVLWHAGVLEGSTDRPHRRSGGAIGPERLGKSTLLRCTTISKIRIQA